MPENAPPTSFADLGRRYVLALHHAWQQRASMEPQQRLPHEAQFLPAALALQETPVSPLPRLTAWLLILFALLAFTWSWLSEVDMVATARGRIVPNARSKIVQSLETASVAAIHVSDGQNVAAGEVLIELDATGAHADQQRLRNDAVAARLQIALDSAVLRSLDSGTAPQLVRPPGVDEHQFLEVQRRLAGQMAEYAAQVTRLTAEVERRTAELQATRGLVQKLEQTLPIATQRAQDLQRLTAGNFVAAHSYLEREQIRIEQQADLEIQSSRSVEIEAALREAQGQRRELLATTRRGALERIAQEQQKLVTLQQELVKVEQRRRLLQLRAPVAGSVQQLAVHTLGGVVSSAQPLLVIVPRDDQLEIEALIENKDIGFVRAGQHAEVKIEAFQYTRYGTIAARVLSVSHDAIENEQRGLVYAARVALQRSTIDVGAAPVALGPGMAVAVEIKTGRRRVIDYFLSPFLQHVDESLRER